VVAVVEEEESLIKDFRTGCGDAASRSSQLAETRREGCNLIIIHSAAERYSRKGGSASNPECWPARSHATDNSELACLLRGARLLHHRGIERIVNVRDSPREQTCGSIKTYHARFGCLHFSQLNKNLALTASKLYGNEAEIDAVGREESTRGS